MASLVTGGAGFIGSNIVEELMKSGEEVTVVDNLSTGSLANLSPFRSKVRVMQDGIRKLPGTKLDGVDRIFHFGIPSSSPMYKDDPYVVGEAINDMISVLEFARKSGSRIVFASSSSLYNSLKPPHSEDMDIRVTDYYTEARYAMERLASLYNLLYGVDVIALRLFSVYGPNEEGKGKYANLVSQFLWSMRKGSSPVIYGDGSQTRDFVYVKDVVRAAMLAMGSDVRTGIFNVGTGSSYSMNDLVGVLNGLLGMSMEAKHIENPIKNYVPCTLADTSKSERVLHFKARYKLADGIREYMSTSGRHVS